MCMPFPLPNSHLGKKKLAGSPDFWLQQSFLPFLLQTTTIVVVVVLVVGSSSSGSVVVLVIVVVLVVVVGGRGQTQNYFLNR